MKRPQRVGRTQYLAMSAEDRAATLSGVQRYIEDRRWLAGSYKREAEEKLATLQDRSRSLNETLGTPVNAETVRWLMGRRDKAASELNNAVYRFREAEGEAERWQELASEYIEIDAELDTTEPEE